MLIMSCWTFFVSKRVLPWIFFLMLTFHLLQGFSFYEATVGSRNQFNFLWRPWKPSLAFVLPFAHFISFYFFCIVAACCFWLRKLACACHNMSFTIWKPEVSVCSHILQSFSVFAFHDCYIRGMNGVHRKSCVASLLPYHSFALK